MDGLWKGAQIFRETPPSWRHIDSPAVRSGRPLEQRGSKLHDPTAPPAWRSSAARWAALTASMCSFPFTTRRPVRRRPAAPLPRPSVGGRASLLAAEWSSPPIYAWKTIAAPSSVRSCARAHRTVARAGEAVARVSAGIPPLVDATAPNCDDRAEHTSHELPAHGGSRRYRRRHGINLRRTRVSRARFRSEDRKRTLDLRPGEDGSHFQSALFAALPGR
jgi:hypothetical protein